MATLEATTTVGTVVLPSLWLGMILFWTAGVTPRVFQVLEREDAGRVVSAVFPLYFGVGALVGLLGAAAALATHGGGLGFVGAVLLLVAVLVTVGNGWVATPRMRRAREHGDRERFAKLHGVSAMANVAVALLVAGALALLGMTLPAL